MDSLFYAGFIKTGIATSGYCLNEHGVNIALGEIFCDHVDPDDMILDPNAKHWDAQLLVGNRFSVLRQDLLDDPTIDHDFVVKMPSSFEVQMKNQAADLIKAKYDDTKEMMDYVDLAEVYIPRDGRIITIPWYKGSNPDRFIRDVDYSGPEVGPYHMLGYNEVPNNILPLPPVSIWYDLHIMGNKMARKISRQADRSKRVLAYDGTAAEDAEAIVDADDGDSVRVQNLNGIKEVNYGGTGEDSYAFMQWVETKFSGLANSLDMLSGQKSDAPTATQSEMLQQNTSIKLADMQNKVYDFTAEVGTDIAFFLHTDPLIELPLVKRVQGVDQQVTYTPEQRKGDFVCYMLDVQPMSMAKPDPNVKVQHLLQFASNVVPAAAQAAQILGPAFKLGPFLERMAQEIGLEEVDEFIDMPTYQAMMLQKLAAEVDPGKAAGFVQGGTGGQPAPAPQPGINPGQPNVTGMTTAPQNVTPTTEAARQAQVVAGQLQQAYPNASAGARAAAINLRGGM